MTIFISSLCVDDSIRILVYDDSIYLGQDQTSLFTDQCLQIETLALTESFSMLLWLFGQKVLGPVGPITLMIGYKSGMQTSPLTFMTTFQACRLILAPQHIFPLIMIGLRILKWGETFL